MNTLDVFLRPFSGASVTAPPLLAGRSDTGVWMLGDVACATDLSERAATPNFSAVGGSTLRRTFPDDERRIAGELSPVATDPVAGSDIVTAKRQEK
jgi:hypothetical protein